MATRAMATPEGAGRLRVLMVSAFFAPSAAVGAKRCSYLARHFEEQGVQVDALALRASPQERRDASLPCGDLAERCGSLLPFPPRRLNWLTRAYKQLLSGFFGVPDPYIGWLPPALWAGRRMIVRAKPDVIIASGPPFTAFLIGAILSRWAGARLILDYRDPWTGFEWQDGPLARRKHGRLGRQLERWALRRADALVFATAAMRESFFASFEIPAHCRTAVITNGFVSGAEPVAKPLRAAAINILYAGSFYGERQIYPLADAVAALSRGGGARGKPVTIHVFGSIKGNDWARIRAGGAAHLIAEHAPVDHGMVLRYMKAADILYLPSGADVAYALPFKLFDYLSVRRPILALAPECSAVATFMREVDCGELAGIEQPGAVRLALERLLGRECGYSYTGAEAYGWDALSRRYVDLLKAVCGRQGSLAEPLALFEG